MSLFIHSPSGHTVALSRTVKGLAYERWIKAAREQLDGMTAESKERAKKANVEFAKGLASPRYSASHEAELDSIVQRAVTPVMVHVDTLLSTLSVMYANDEYIGERIMTPVPVGKRSDKFAVYTKRDRFSYPDDEIGYRSSPNELDASRTTDNYSVKDYGYKNFLDLETVQNQDAPLNEMLDVIEAVNNGIAFRREKRINAIIFNAATYGSQTTTATVNWNDTTGTGGGSIVADLLAARSALWTGPNPTRKIGFCPLVVWNTGIANNPAIHDLYKYNSSGMPTTTQIAGYFGLDDILVSQAREDTANIGQTASYSRMITSDVFGIAAVAERATVRSLHFGSTFRMNGSPKTTEWTDPSIGASGGIWGRVSTSEDHKVVSADAAYYLTSLLT